MQNAFINALSKGLQLAPLFDQLGEVYLFVKNREGHFMRANRSFVRMMGLREECEIIGRTDHDFFPPHLVEEYRKEDDQVMNSETPLQNYPQLVSNASGSIDWFVTSKIPLYGRSNDPASVKKHFRGAGKDVVIGIAGVMRDIQKAGELLEPYEEMHDVLEYIFAHHSTPITNEELARIVHLSVSQFRRRFTATFNESPQQFVMKVRLQTVARLLVTTDLPLRELAAETGFYDQSHFSKQFRARYGCSPNDYRRQFASR